MRRIALELFVELSRVGKRLHCESLLAQVAHQEIAQASIVVDDQDLRCRRLHRLILTAQATRLACRLSRIVTPPQQGNDSLQERSAAAARSADNEPHRRSASLKESNKTTIRSNACATGCG